VMDGLKALDHVAYIRFASIYKDFTEPGHFAEIAESVEKEGAAPSADSDQPKKSPPERLL
jgi:transcriptional repressor NrdR